MKLFEWHYVRLCYIVCYLRYQIMGIFSQRTSMEYNIFPLQRSGKIFQNYSLLTIHYSLCKGTHNGYVIMYKNICCTTPRRPCRPAKTRSPWARSAPGLRNPGSGTWRTYIQSGNVLLDSDLAMKEVEVRVHDVIQKKIGPDLAVVARTAAQLRKILRGKSLSSRDSTSPASSSCCSRISPHR